MSNIRIPRRALLAGAAATAATVAITRPAHAAELKIGVDLSLTGGTDDFGKGARMGIELATNEFNAAGGYKGQKVELVIYDDETKPAKGVENVTRLITRDRGIEVVESPRLVAGGLSLKIGKRLMRATSHPFTLDESKGV